MSISIIIVTYNSSQKIVRLLHSIGGQLGNHKINVIIVDNNSIDKINLQNKIQKIKHKNYKLFLYLRRKNYGFGNSCNYGAHHTLDPYLLFLNPDTKLLPSSISILLKHLISSKSQIIGGKSVTFDNKIIHRTVFNKPSPTDLLFEFSNVGKLLRKHGNFYIDQNNLVQDTVVGGVGGAYLLIKSKIFSKLGGFDKKIFMYLEDVDLCNRATKLGYKISYCPHSIILHEGGASSDNKYHIHHKSWYESREYYTRKYFSRWISIPINIIFKIERLLLNLRLLILQ